MLVEILIVSIIVIFVGFLLGVCLHLGFVPKSISDTFYDLGKKGRLFSVFLTLIAIPLFIIGGEVENYFYLAAGICLCFTAVAADFRQDLTDTVHVAGAIGGIGLVLVGLLFDGLWYPLALEALAFVVIRLDQPRKVLGFQKAIGNKTFWVEACAFLVSMPGLIQVLHGKGYFNGYLQ
jgi:hypothetical protein